MTCDETKYFVDTHEGLILTRASSGIGRFSRNIIFAPDGPYALISRQYSGSVSVTLLDTIGAYANLWNITALISEKSRALKEPESNVGKKVQIVAPLEKPNILFMYVVTVSLCASMEKSQTKTWKHEILLIPHHVYFKFLIPVIFIRK